MGVEGVEVIIGMAPLAGCGGIITMVGMVWVVGVMRGVDDLGKAIWWSHG